MNDIEQMMKSTESDTVPTDYTCIDCNSQQVSSLNLNQNWKIYICESCGSKTPLSNNDLIREATDDQSS